MLAAPLSPARTGLRAEMPRLNESPEAPLPLTVVTFRAGAAGSALGAAVALAAAVVGAFGEGSAVFATGAGVAAVPVVGRAAAVAEGSAVGAGALAAAEGSAVGSAWVGVGAAVGAGVVAGSGAGDAPRSLQASRGRAARARVQTRGLTP